MERRPAEGGDDGDRGFPFLPTVGFSSSSLWPMSICPKQLTLTKVIKCSSLPTLMGTQWLDDSRKIQDSTTEREA
jgi:hypothetical protein